MLLALAGFTLSPAARLAGFKNNVRTLCLDKNNQKDDTL